MGNCRSAQTKEGSQCQQGTPAPVALRSHYVTQCEAQPMQSNPQLLQVETTQEEYIAPTTEDVSNQQLQFEFVRYEQPAEVVH